MNLDYFLLHLPTVDPGLPVLPARRPGPVRADHQPGPAVRDRRPTGDGRASWWLLGATIAVLIPTLLYYGGGWLQYGYRYFLDSVPFVIALCGLAAVQQGRIGCGLARADRLRHGRDGLRRLLGRQDLMDATARRLEPAVAGCDRCGSA